MNIIKKYFKNISFIKYGFRFSDMSIKNNKKLKDIAKTNFVYKNEENIENEKLELSDKEKEEVESVKISYSSLKGAKQGDSSHYVILFTCGVCEQRHKKIFTKKAYTQGIVVIRCDNCNSYHLIADNLGWVKDEKFNIENYMKEHNQTIKKLQMDGLWELGVSEKI